MKVEEWKPVKGFEDRYLVSNFGRVKSLSTTVTDKNGKRTRVFKERILNNVCSNTGYHMVSLHANNHRQSRRTVHRLIMESFNPVKDSDKLVVDHIDGNRSNNMIENLRWVDYSTNNRNTPYVRYLQTLLNNNNIEFISEDKYEN